MFKDTSDMYTLYTVHSVPCTTGTMYAVNCTKRKVYRPLHIPLGKVFSKGKILKKKENGYKIEFGSLFIKS